MVELVPKLRISSSLTALAVTLVDPSRNIAIFKKPLSANFDNSGPRPLVLSSVAYQRSHHRYSYL